MTGLALGLGALGLLLGAGVGVLWQRHLSARQDAERAATVWAALGGGDGDLDRALEAALDGLETRERLLRRNDALQQLIFDNAPGGVVVVGSSGLLRAVNPAVESVLPVTPDPVGKAPRTAIPFPPLHDVMEETLRTGEPVERTCSSGRFDLIVRAVPLGEGGGALAIIVDVTSIKRAERVRSDFIANVSHELRTPVTSIIGFSETLLDSSTLADDDRMMLEAVTRNARRLTLIFEDLLHLARLEAKAENPDLERLPLDAMIAEAVSLAEDHAQTRRVSIHVEHPQGVQARVDPKAFARIVGNLLSNAIKYSPDKGTVRLVVRPGPEAVTLWVEDDGPGIDPEHHGRVFERFFRVDRGRSRDVGGTGLGLAIVKHLCKATGAVVDVKSNPGHGAAFSVRFPA